MSVADQRDVGAHLLLAEWLAHNKRTHPVNYLQKEHVTKIHRHQGIYGKQSQMDSTIFYLLVFFLKRPDLVQA